MDEEGGDKKLHSMRNAEIHVFERVLQNPVERPGRQWCAMFHPYDKYPMIFRGNTAAQVIEAAEEIRAEAIMKHEAEVIRRGELAKRARERAAKKKAQEEMEAK